MDTLTGEDYDGIKKSKHETRVILSPQPDCYDDSMALDTGKYHSALLQVHRFHLSILYSLYKYRCSLMIDRKY